jgi:hypothetical protein
VVPHILKFVEHQLENWNEWMRTGLLQQPRQFLFEIQCQATDFLQNPILERIFSLLPADESFPSIMYENFFA